MLIVDYEKVNEPIEKVMLSLTHSNQIGRMSVHIRNDCRITKHHNSEILQKLAKPCLWSIKECSILMQHLQIKLLCTYCKNDHQLFTLFRILDFIRAMTLSEDNPANKLCNFFSRIQYSIFFKSLPRT